MRGVAWQLTEAKDQQAVYAALDAHFEPMATPEWQEVESLADLTPAIERYNTLVGLGRYDDAFDLFRDRLEDATHYRLAAHRERIALLERLFPDGTRKLPALRAKPTRAWHSTRWHRAIRCPASRAEPRRFFGAPTKLTNG